jgi:cytoskeletal protein CcmA (bactofilin family)
MAIFGRTKPREDGPGEAAVGPGPVQARDPDIGVPPFRPAQHEAPSMTLAPKPTAAPATPSLSPRLGPTAPTQPITGATQAGGVGVPARPVRPEPGPADRRTLVVGRGISLQGTVADAERLVVEGTVESQMIQAQELFVAQAGVFRGEVQVEDAEIAGLFDGTLTVRGSLTIRGTGKVNGTARYRRLAVEEGGVVSGRMETIGEGGGGNGAAAAAPAHRPSVAAEAEA